MGIQSTIALILGLGLIKFINLQKQSSLHKQTLELRSQLIQTIAKNIEQENLSTNQPPPSDDPSSSSLKSDIEKLESEIQQLTSENEDLTQAINDIQATSHALTTELQTTQAEFSASESSIKAET